MRTVQRIINYLENIEMQHASQTLQSFGYTVENCTVITINLGRKPFIESALWVAMKSRGFTQKKVYQEWEIWEKEDIQIRIMY